MKISSVVPFSLLAMGLMVLPGIAGHAGQAPGRIRFAPAMVIPGPGTYPTGIASGDFNNDGIPDLVGVAPTTGEAGIALGNGDGTFGSWLGSFATYSPGLVAVGKFDGVNLDAVVNDEAVGNALVLLGSGDGYFPNSTFINMGDRHAQGFAVADFNGDHNQDLAATDGAGIVAIYLGNGDGTFRSRQSYPAGSKGGTCIIAGDFNGDGVIDLAVLNTGIADGMPGIAVLPGVGNGRFGTPIVFHLPSSFTLVDFASADLNGDHVLDLAITEFQQNGKIGALILLGNGNGTFKRGGQYNAGPAVSSIATADFNGDGKIDLAVGDTNPTTDDGYVSVLLGNGDGTFQPRTTFPLNGQGTGRMTIADFNGDGKSDIAILDILSSTVSVLLNTTPFPAIKSSVSQR